MSTIFTKKHQTKIIAFLKELYSPILNVEDWEIIFYDYSFDKDNDEFDVSIQLKHKKSHFIISKRLEIHRVHFQIYEYGGTYLSQRY
jgi:hypothetical protein